MGGYYDHVALLFMRRTCPIIYIYIYIICMDRSQIIINIGKKSNINQQELKSEIGGRYYFHIQPIKVLFERIKNSFELQYFSSMELSGI